MKTRLMAAAFVGLATVAQAEELPRFFELHMVMLGTLQKYCPQVQFNPEALAKLKDKANGFEPKIGNRTPEEIKDACLRDPARVNEYVATELGIPGLILAATDGQPPEGFDTFRTELDFAYTYCTSGTNLVRFDKNALNEVGRKMDAIKAKAGMPLYLVVTPPAPTDPNELADRCRFARDELGYYADTVLGIPGLVR